MPRKTYSQEQEQEARAMIKEMESDQMSGLTMADISRKTRIRQTTLGRWRNQPKDSPNQPPKVRRRKTADKESIDYKTSYELELLRNQYLSKGIRQTPESRKNLEIEYLREMIHTVFHQDIKPLFEDEDDADTVVTPKKSRAYRRRG